MNNKTTYKDNELTSIQEDILLEDINEKSNETNEGIFDTWKYENHSDLITEFVEEHDEEFREYCKARFKEVFE